MQIQLTAREFINPWGVAMPSNYVVSLSAPIADLETFLDIITVISRDDGWSDCHYAAQRETEGDYREDGNEIVRYLVHRTEYEKFKQAVREAKASVIAKGEAP
jgi:hypothetical protein